MIKLVSIEIACRFYYGDDKHANRVNMFVQSEYMLHP